MAERRRCACVNLDAMECAASRYGGDACGEPCECVCHEEDEDDDNRPMTDAEFGAMVYPPFRGSSDAQ